MATREWYCDYCEGCGRVDAGRIGSRARRGSGAVHLLEDLAHRCALGGQVADHERGRRQKVSSAPIDRGALRPAAQAI